MAVVPVLAIIEVMLILLDIFMELGKHVTGIFSAVRMNRIQC
jgi:hypothetical protein